MRYVFFVQCCNGMNVWLWMGGNARATTSRRRKKYRGLYETQAAAALILERQNIKNRAAAARTFQQKQVTSQQLQLSISITVL